MSLVVPNIMYITDMQKLIAKKRMISFNVSAAIVAGIIPYIAVTKKYLFFQNNDDLFILGRVSGMFYGTPLDELIYVSPPLSTLMKYLYIFNNSYSWYTIILLFTQYLAVFSYLLIFEKKINSLSLGNGFILYVIASLPIFVFFILFHSLQFTQTGIMAAGLGALSFLLSDTKSKKILGLSLVTLGILWRSDGSLVAILFVLAFFFFIDLLTSKKIIIKPLVKKFLPIVLVASFSYGVYVASFNDWAPWIDQEKKEYVQLKNVFTQLYGFESTATSYLDLEIPAKEAGFTTNDWALFQKYYFLNEDVFGVETQAVIAQNRFQDSYLVFFQKTFDNLIRLLTTRYAEVIIVSFAFSLLAIVLARQKRVLVFLGFWTLLSASYLMILLFGERLPERVFWPLTFVALATLIGTILVNYSNFQGFTNFGFASNILLGVAALIFIFTFSDLFKLHQKKVYTDLWWKVAAEQNILGIEKVYNFKPDKPVVAFFSFYENFRKTLDPLDAPSELPAIWKDLILIGWENKTPEFNKRLLENGLTPDLFTSVALGDAYLATWTNPSDNFEAGNGSIYLREHKNIEVIWDSEPVVFSDAGLIIWRAADFEVIK